MPPSVSVGDILDGIVVDVISVGLVLLVSTGIHVVWDTDNGADFTNYPTGSRLSVVVTSIDADLKSILVVPSIHIGIFRD